MGDNSSRAVLKNLLIQNKILSKEIHSCNQIFCRSQVYKPGESRAAHTEVTVTALSLSSSASLLGQNVCSDPYEKPPNYEGPGLKTVQLSSDSMILSLSKCQKMLPVNCRIMHFSTCLHVKLQERVIHVFINICRVLPLRQALLCTLGIQIYFEHKWKIQEYRQGAGGRKHKIRETYTERVTVEINLSHHSRWWDVLPLGITIWLWQHSRPAPLNFLYLMISLSYWCWFPFIVYSPF